MAADRDGTTRAPVKPAALAVKASGQGTAWALVWGWLLPSIGIPDATLPTVTAVLTSFSTGASLAVGNAVRNFRTAAQERYPAGTVGRLLLDLLSFIG